MGLKEKFRERLWLVRRSSSYIVFKDRVKRSRTTQFAISAILILLFVGLFADYLAPKPYWKQFTEHTYESPSLGFLMGVDHLGRDILSRVIIGANIAIYVMFTVILLSTCLGLTIGLVSGFTGGIVDAIIMRLIDIWLAFPPILLGLVLLTILGTGINNAVLAVSIALAAPYARLVRAQVIQTKERLFVENARALGVGNLGILFRHIIPNISSPLIVQAAFSLASALLSEAALSFIGLGVQPPMPSWGLMIYEARIYMRISPYGMIFPGIALFLTVLSFNILGETLRDIMDPRSISIVKL